MIEIAYENIEKVRTKQCTKCKEIKPFSEFVKHKGRKFGLSNQCRECYKQYYQENKEKLDEKNKQWREKNKEKIREYNKKHRLENKEKIRIRMKKFYLENKEKRKEYLLYNKEKIAEKARTHYRKTKNMFPKEFEEKYYCQKCGKELTIVQINCNQLYCSRKCCGLANRIPEAQVLRKYFRGYNWQFKRKIIRERDNYLCQICGEEENGLEHDVHHIVSWHSFSDKLEANNNSNLITLCQSCHRKHENDNSYFSIFLQIVEENEMFFLSKKKQSEMIES